MKPDRKEFLKTAMVMAGAGIGLVHGIGCGGADDSPSDAGGSSGGRGGGSGGSGSGGNSTGSGGAGTGSGGATTGSGGATTGSGGAGTGGRSTGSGGAGTGGRGTGGAGTGTNACDLREPAETILTNHGAGTEHTLVVAAADVTAGVAKTYSIRGNSAHDHSVTISAAQFTMLRAGTQVMSTSTTGGGHTHVVRVTCA